MSMSIRSRSLGGAEKVVDLMMEHFGAEKGNKEAELALHRLKDARDFICEERDREAKKKLSQFLKPGAGSSTNPVKYEVLFNKKSNGIKETTDPSKKGGFSFFSIYGIPASLEKNEELMKVLGSEGIVLSPDQGMIYPSHSDLAQDPTCEIQ